jgi:hypothetical protein
MNKEFPMTNDELRIEMSRPIGHLSFELAHYLVIRASSFVIHQLLRTGIFAEQRT